MLTQHEADWLLKLSKAFEKTDPISLNPGVDETHDLFNDTEKEQFKLDIRRGSIKLTKVTNQHRARKSCILVRLDIDGPPHQNPDGSKVPCPHIHLFKEGDDDKWVYPVDISEFSDLTDPEQVFHDFCQFCNITNPPTVAPYAEQNQLL